MTRKWCYECTTDKTLMVKEDDEMIDGWVYRWYRCPTCWRRVSHRRRQV